MTEMKVEEVSMSLQDALPLIKDRLAELHKELSMQLNNTLPSQSKQFCVIVSGVLDLLAGIDERSYSSIAAVSQAMTRLDLKMSVLEEVLIQKDPALLETYNKACDRKIEEFNEELRAKLESSKEGDV